MNVIKDNILAKLNELKLSIYVLEKRSSLPRGTIQNIISGKSKNPGIYTVQSIAQALGCTIINLIDENSSHESKDGFSPLTKKVYLQNKAFSPREIQCLLYLSRGNSIKEIGKILNLSPRTVEVYINNIKHKNGFRSTSEIIKWYWDQQVPLEPPPLEGS